MVKELLASLEQYQKDIDLILKSDLSNPANSRSGIELSKTQMHLYRTMVWDKKFDTMDDEIQFFKHIKPFINGRIIFFSTLFTYLINKSNGTIQRQRVQIDEVLRNQEMIIHRNAEFYGYYASKDDRLDEVYFVRGHAKINLIADPSYYFSDPNFSTSHDNLASQIIGYELCTDYFNKQLENLRRSELNISAVVESPAILNDLSWTATKTDLVELIYALQSSGAIRNGNAELKKMVAVCEELFAMNLGNTYKTYSKIKLRKHPQTSFLNHLKNSLELRISKEDENY